MLSYHHNQVTAITIMSLYNYISRHTQRDLRFDNIKNDPSSIFDERIERDNNS